jgi:hypothetical protein
MSKWRPRLSLRRSTAWWRCHPGCSNIRVETVSRIRLPSKAARTAGSKAAIRYLATSIAQRRGICLPPLRSLPQLATCVRPGESRLSQHFSHTYKAGTTARFRLGTSDQRSSHSCNPPTAVSRARIPRLLGAPSTRIEPRYPVSRSQTLRQLPLDPPIRRINTPSRPAADFPSLHRSALVGANVAPSGPAEEQCIHVFNFKAISH